VEGGRGKGRERVREGGRNLRAWGAREEEMRRGSHIEEGGRGGKNTGKVRKREVGKWECNDVVDRYWGGGETTEG